ncbi:hypothetical protein CPU12_09595 [Malaciobacter molluscorum LMG 25693]|uniref:beta-lactamase n=1 Tax=Malaciobacter molluscorum LMG 25693 TaxID=870501 RepID=A0A2G1DGB7_9BACT|nr:tetratricopeptide repeat protein [Malaciobacter molluscorum]AXX91455.1 tetratricopeptide repeat protein [Malaciobacter molluscorum LMG 25693]PHO17541.1 hypothetical protein CPU12_09595 [Malaciobacter molluscorum LMG 25693]
MKIKKVLKLLLAINIIFIFVGCNNSDKEVKHQTSLSIPEWNSKIAKFSNSNGGILYQSAKTDPSAATKIGYSYSEELKDYDKAIKWYKYSNSMKSTGVNSNYMCYAYQMKKDYDEAIKWCKNAIDLSNNDALYRIGYLYSKIKNYEEAIKYYEISYEKTKDKMSANNIGFIYQEKIKDYESAKKWYLIGVKENNMSSFHNLSMLYHHNLNDDLRASAYSIALINNKFTKSSVLNTLQKTWKIPNNIIQKGYELQLNSDEFPIKYKGKLDLDE